MAGGKEFTESSEEYRKGFDNAVDLFIALYETGIKPELIFKGMKESVEAR